MVRTGLRTDNDGMTFIMKAVILLVIFAIVSAVYVNFVAYRASDAAGEVRTVEMKDTVRISYIGYFENGLVFDTSIESVADDNSTWPKALSFTPRSAYSDFTFTAGKTACQQGETDCAIIGMTQAVLGHPERSIVIATITPENGYGPRNPSLVSVRQVHEELPVRETMNSTAFVYRYKTAPRDGVPVEDPLWGWTVMVHVSGEKVEIENSPDIAGSYRLYANESRGGEWHALVEGIDDSANNGAGAISIFNLFTFTGEKKLLVNDRSGDFFVIDNEDGTFTVDKNREVVGVNLVFRIGILSITKAS